MGFDMNITCALNMCLETGKPYILSKNMQRIYDLSQIVVVPQEHRKYMQLCGSVFYEYIQSFGNDETIVDASAFFERFPSWDDVKLDETNGTWTPSDHNKFYTAMQWFANAEVNYLVSWSY